MKGFIIIIGIQIVFMPNPHKDLSICESITVTEKETLKEGAFVVLQRKCNVCHLKKNRRRVFTLENMDSHGEGIYKQVFEKKRMPKGNNYTLTLEEYNQLEDWIKALKNNDHGTKH